ncbi:collagen alpha-1(X) chain-like [Penaeus japonicus]|uniref:collagen alpha-1(X) chain-like n=1 Tax=Penaeus japonicus TaxID=27405 RepID=UPI001C71358C|nr:collagen alpha-1(X) chain-like [Penaeus japonicus]
MKFVLALTLLGLCSAAPQFQAAPVGQVTFGVDEAGCVVGPSGKVCPSGPVQFTSGAQGVPQPFVPQPPRPFAPQPPAHHAFTGLVGPSGVIGPSGLVGPSGPVHFG